MGHRKLSDRQRLFAQEYLVDLNATKAAERAGYSKKTAQVQGSQNLSKLMVREEIQRLMTARSHRTEITSDNVLKALAKHAFYDPRNFFDEKGNPKEIHELDDETAAGVAGFEFVTLYEGGGDEKHAFGQLRKIRLVDRGLNLERLGRHLKLFTDKLEMSEPDEFAGKTNEELRHYAQNGCWPAANDAGTAAINEAVSGKKNCGGDVDR